MLIYIIIVVVKKKKEKNTEKKKSAKNVTTARGIFVTVDFRCRQPAVGILYGILKIFFFWFPAGST